MSFVGPTRTSVIHFAALQRCGSARTAEVLQSETGCRSALGLGKAREDPRWSLKT